MLGKTVGKYRILERLGRGGMGVVYKALDETLDREVAIKVINSDVGETEVLKRFRAEAISLARLNHPGIATIYELHRHEEDLLMVMEFVRGETLQTLSERLGPLAPPQAADLITQVLDALSHAHRAGIVHRDLKPANVMVTDVGVVKVMDFGIARMIGGEHHTTAGFMMGTPAYMAPEQVLGQEIDGRADLYSVGVLFYRLLTRELPFQADTAIAMARKQVAEEPTPLGTFRADLPPWCEAIINKALTKSPDARFQTAEEFRAGILAAVRPVTLSEMPTMATPTAATLLRTADLSMHASAQRTLPMPDARTGPSATVEKSGMTVVLGRGHLFSLVGLLVALVAGMIALGILSLKRGGSVLQNIVPSANVPAPPSTTESTTAQRGPDPQPPAVPVATVARESAAATPGSTTAAGTTAPSGSTTPAATPAATAPPKSKPLTKAAQPPVPNEPALTLPPGPSPTKPAAAPAPVPAPAPAPPPLTFKEMKMLVAQGDTRRERDAELTFVGDQLTLRDSTTQAVLVTVPYSSITQAFFSRSKQPKWKGSDGKETSVSVDLGKMGFFRGDRNWVILVTKDYPLFVRFEDRELAAVLRAIEERTGVKIQR